MKKLILGGVLAALAFAPATSALATDPTPANPAQIEGCVVRAGDTPCTYTATRSGGLAGRGTYVVSVQRGATVTNHSDQGVCTGIIIAGDVVTVTVTDGGAGAGNPLPFPADSAPSTGNGAKSCHP
jgi:hypothetical protein